MRLGLPHLAATLVIGVIAGLLLSSLIGTPLNLANNVTRVVTTSTTVTTTTTKVTTSLALWPYSLSFRQYGVGPYGWDYNLKINPDSSATISYHRDTTGNASLTLSNDDLDQLSQLILNANILHLNNSYPAKQGYYDYGFYNLTLTTHNQTKSVGWALGASAIESTPKELHEIEDYLNKIVFNAIPK